MRGKNKVSIIVPNYNYCRFLHKRMESIFEQSYDNYEVILLDDCSSDGSGEYLRELSTQPKVKKCIINESNTGSPFLQWERGLQEADGEYVWIAESDDWCLPNFLEILVDALNANEKTSFAMVGSIMVDENDREIKGNYDSWEEDHKTIVYQSDDYLRHFLYWGCTSYNASMILFRRKAYAKISKAFTTMRYCGDWRFWTEMAMQGEVVEVHEKLNRFRQHTQRVTNQSSGTKNLLDEKILLMKYIWSSVPNDSCRLSLAKGVLYKKAMRINMSDTEKKSTIDRLHKDLNISKANYVHERIIKCLSHIFPFLYLPSKDNILCRKKYYS